MRKLICALLLINLTACQKNTDSAPPKPDDQIYQRIIQSTKSPSAGEQKKITFWDELELENGTLCGYQITQTISVNSVTPQAIEMRWNHSQYLSETTGDGCPAQHPDYGANEHNSKKLAEYIQSRQNMILRNSSATEFAKHSANMIDIRVIESTEVTYKNIRSQLVTMLMTSKISGKTYKRLAYISLDSYFAGVFETQTYRTSDSKLVDSTDLLGIRLNNPNIQYGSL